MRAHCRRPASLVLAGLLLAGQPALAEFTPELNVSTGAIKEFAVELPKTTPSVIDDGTLVLLLRVVGDLPSGYRLVVTGRSGHIVGGVRAGDPDHDGIHTFDIPARELDRGFGGEHEFPAQARIVSENAALPDIMIGFKADVVAK